MIKLLSRRSLGGLYFFSDFLFVVLFHVIRESLKRKDELRAIAILADQSSTGTKQAILDKIFSSGYRFFHGHWTIGGLTGIAGFSFLRRKN